MKPSEPKTETEQKETDKEQKSPTGFQYESSTSLAPLYWMAAFLVLVVGLYLLGERS